MNGSLVFRARVALVAACVVALSMRAGEASAQRLPGNANPAGLNQPAGGFVPPDLPNVPPNGAWGEVIFANARWMVVQNHQGQQFPIDANSVRQFLIRWPTTLDELTNASVVEAIGPDLGSNTLQTDHIDVFEGGDRSLVSPTYVSLLPNNQIVTTVDPGFNRFMNGFDIGAQNLLYGWAYPVPPGNSRFPARLHVVGNVLAVEPWIRVSIPGNNFATVMPMPPGVLAITQVTRGDTSFAEKGDLIYLMPTGLSPRSVLLSQVVLYKKQSLRQFRPADR